MPDRLPEAALAEGPRALTVELPLEPVPPFRLDLTGLALQRRSNNVIDVWDGQTLRRVLPASASGGRIATPFLIEVSSATARGASDDRLRVRVTGQAEEAELAAAGAQGVSNLLGLNRDLTDFYALAADDKRLAPLVRRLEGLKPPRYPGVFEGLLNAVPCQQVTLTFGLQLVERMARAYGPQPTFLAPYLATGPLGLPAPEALARAEPEALSAMGFSRAKARTLIELAKEVSSGVLDVEGLGRLPDDRVQERLGALFGVGRWTAEYVLLRALGRLNVFPDGDSGARNGLARFVGEPGKPSYAWVAELVAQWQPFAGFVYLHLLVDKLAPGT